MFIYAGLTKMGEKPSKRRRKRKNRAKKRKNRRDNLEGKLLEEKVTKLIVVKIIAKLKNRATTFTRSLL